MSALFWLNVPGKLFISFARWMVAFRAKVPNDSLPFNRLNSRLELEAPEMDSEVMML